MTSPRLSHTPRLPKSNARWRRGKREREETLFLLKILEVDSFVERETLTEVSSEKTGRGEGGKEKKEKKPDFGWIGIIFEEVK